MFGCAQNHRNNQIFYEIYRKCEQTDLFGTTYSMKEQTNVNIPLRTKK